MQLKLNRKCKGNVKGPHEWQISESTRQVYFLKGRNSSRNAKSRICKSNNWGGRWAELQQKSDAERTGTESIWRAPSSRSQKGPAKTYPLRCRAHLEEQGLCPLSAVLVKDLGMQGQWHVLSNWAWVRWQSKQGYTKHSSEEPQQPESVVSVKQRGPLPPSTNPDANSWAGKNQVIKKQVFMKGYGTASVSDFIRKNVGKSC